MNIVKKPIKIAIFSILFLIFFTTANAHAAIFQNPWREGNFSYRDLEQFSWLQAFKKGNLWIGLNDTAKQFITGEAAENYFKLKMRNFIKDYNVQTKFSTDNDMNFISLYIELYRYNDKTKIYYGLMSFRIHPSLGQKTKDIKTYEITIPLAGSENQINSLIKEEIDFFVETFATDYYYIEDLKTKHESQKSE